MTIDHRAEALSTTLDVISKRFGQGALMRLGQRPISEVPIVSTGSSRLDAAIGIGGYPRGRVIEVFGPESSGKTTLALHAIAEIQRKGGTAAMIDAEHALDVNYARALGVDCDALLVSQPDSGEQALDITEALVRSGAVDIIVIDSVAALTPQAEIEGDMGDSHMGLQARLMSQALRKITAITARSGTIVLFINQIRQKIGVTFGNGETTTGGNALKFYASIRLDIRRIGALKKGEEAIGSKTRIKVVKNKLAPPFREAEVEIVWGRGICNAGELIDSAEEAGVLTKNGSWFILGEDRLGNGREALREAIRADIHLAERIRAKLPGAVALAK